VRPLFCPFLALVIAAGCASSSRATSVAAPDQPPINTGDLPLASDAAAESLLVDLARLDSTILVDARYATADNFTGAPLPGYRANRALLRREAAAALVQVADRVARDGLRLKVFDAYRPVRATVAMVEWTRRMKRADLLRDGYIATRSRHNLGAAIDLTLVDKATRRELDMGTPFDTFSPAAHTSKATGVIAENRARLKSAMEAEGFVNYDREWWHFSYEVTHPVRFDTVIR
jgi:zinc D-Ala-D-Ala dipeptidase